MAKSASNNPSAVLQPHSFSGKANFQVIADPGHTLGSKAGGSNTKSTSLTQCPLGPTYHPQLFIRKNPWHSALGSVCQAASGSPRAQTDKPLVTMLAAMVSSPARRAGGRAREMPSQEGREAAAAGRAAEQESWPDLHRYPLYPHILSFSHAVNYSIQLNPGFD